MKYFRRPVIDKVFLFGPSTDIEEDYRPNHGKFRAQDWDGADQWHPLVFFH